MTSSSTNGAAARETGRRAALFPNCNLLLQVQQKVAVVVLIALVPVCCARAERYLTAEEAQTLCFPQADRFEERVHQFTDEEKKAIAKKCGSPVRLRGQRYWIAHQGTNILGVVVADHVLGKHEIIDYAVALSPTGAVMQVEILEYRESHGYEVRGEKWRAQFKDKTTKDKLRLNGDIYNISGATISCRNVTEGVKRVLATFDLVLRAALSADRVPDKPAPPKD
jgi:Na+-translocating ferredoxin:NAD+ oxidoreductase subunit G